MDFSIIEGLTEEELNELYDNNIIKDDVYTSNCICNNSNGIQICFGVHHWVNYGYALYIDNCTYNPPSRVDMKCGYCAMSEGRYETECKEWCNSHGGSWIAYNNSCTCTKNGVHRSNWADCPR